MKLRVLFVCAENALQSPIAETLLHHLDSEHFDATSAGIECGTIHPFTIDAMRSIGIDLEGRATKTVRDVKTSEFDFVITLCERSRFECPEFRGADRVHWRLDNPLVESDPTSQKRLFESLRDQIAQRVRLFALVQIRAASSEPQVLRARRLSA